MDTTEGISFKQQVVSGVKWTAFGNVSRQALQFVIIAVLARLLSPEDFGLVAMILLLVEFATLFSELGFGAALIQKKELEERHLSSVFWVNVGAGLLLTALFALGAPLVAAFYDEPALAPLTIALSLSFLLGAFNTVQAMLCRRDMAFRRLALFFIIPMIIGGVAGLGLALAGFGVWALVGRYLVQQAAQTAIMWHMTAWKPRFMFDWQAVRELSGFSLNMVGFRTLTYWTRSTDTLLMGRFTDAASLGLYNRAFSTLVMPVTQVTRTLALVMFPALSRIQDEPARVRNIVLRSYRLIALITLPFILGLAATAEPFIVTIYGPQWISTAPILRVMALATLTQPLIVPMEWVYLSQGRADLQFRWALITGLTTIVAFAVGVQWGALGVAAAYAIPGYVLWYPSVVIPGRLIGLGFGEYLRNIAPLVACALVMAAVVWLVGLALPPDWPHWAQLVVMTLAGVGVYGGLVAGLRMQAYHDLRAVLKR
jgi:O-antigen/teichoic acid export membrane protein